MPQSKEEWSELANEWYTIFEHWIVSLSNGEKISLAILIVGIIGTYLHQRHRYQEKKLRERQRIKRLDEKEKAEKKIAEKELANKKPTKPPVQIHFKENNASFTPVDESSGNGWFDTSYKDASFAIGKLRMPGVSNGRYAPKHPIFDAEGNNVGFLVKGAQTLGYTYCCVFVDKANCFYILHVPFSAVWGNSPKLSCISIVSATSEFTRGDKGMKFETIQRFALPNNYVGSGDLAFKLIDDNKYLLQLSQHGFGLIDIDYSRLLSKCEFGDASHSVSDFSLSPNSNLLAIIFSMDDYNDPISGAYKYKNFVRIYNLKTGELFGEKTMGNGLLAEECRDWKIKFSDDGGKIEISSKTMKQVFELVIKR